ncbi:MAG TPA: hypothetical protein VHD84_02175 [Candidatus Saccharimonadales bacterium]|nr:hypothetical protein [Candidatus Saccharimonadales bacterium]
MSSDALSEIAEQLAEEFIRRRKLHVEELFENAVAVAGNQYRAQMAVILAFAKRAAVAREAGHHGVVSRLLNGAHNYRPERLQKASIRQIFSGAGAIGHRPPKAKQHLPGAPQTMLKLTKSSGSEFGVESLLVSR